MADPLWVPSAERIESTRLQEFSRFLTDRFNVEFDGYGELHNWSVEHSAEFWASIWDFCGVIASNQGDTVIEDADQFPGARWFPEARLNFAENLLRYRDDRVALVSLLENGERRELSFAELYLRVSQLAAALRSDGVVAGDRVAGFMPNIEETVIAMLAASCDTCR